MEIAGAIYKNKWQAFAQFRDLATSLHYYRRGYECGIRNDNGCTAINAAYVYDLTGDAASAKSIRREIVAGRAFIGCRDAESERRLVRSRYRLPKLISVWSSTSLHNRR